MGVINARLSRMFEVAKPGASLAIIVTLTRPVVSTDLAAARAAGASTSFLGTLANSYGARASRNVAVALARLDGVREVFPDEPIGAHDGNLHGEDHARGVGA